MKTETPNRPPVQDLASFRLDPKERGRPGWFVQLWWIMQGVLFNTSPHFMFGWRRWLLRLFGAQIGTGVLIRPGVRVTYPWKLTIGDHSWIGDEVHLYNLALIKIGKNCVVSQGSYLCTGTHDYDDSSFPQVVSEILVGSEAWIATQVFIGPGVNIGNGAVVGARSVVLKDVPSYAKAVGHPAKVIGARNCSKED